MTAPDLATLVGTTKTGIITLDPPGKEFQGPLVIRNPVTINGQGGTIWAEKGPVLIIESTGVVLNDLNIEVTGGEGRLSASETCAILARNTPPKLNRVAVRGQVLGIPGEEGTWSYPRILRLNRVKADTSHTFLVRLEVPVKCRVESLVSGVSITPTELSPGQVELTLRVDSLSAGIRLRGLLKLTTGGVTRRIELSGHVAADGPGVTTGTGQVLFQPVHEDGTQPTSLPPVVPPPVLPSDPSPSDVITLNPAPESDVILLDDSHIIDLPPSEGPVAPAARAVPTPTASGTPPTPPAKPKPKTRYRSIGSTADSLFASPPPPTEEELAGETTDSTPVADSTPASTPPSDPVKKSGMRKINRLPGLFGGDPPANPE